MRRAAIIALPHVAETNDKDHSVISAISALLNNECVEVRQAALSALPHVAETNDKVIA